jgi:hypothetical protein
MPGATLTQSPAQKQQQQLNAQRLQNAKLQSGEGLNGAMSGSNGDATHDAWNNYYANLGNPFLQPKLEDIRIEIPLEVQVPAEKAPQIIQQELNYEQKEIDYDEGQVLEAVQELNQNQELSAFGSLDLSESSVISHQSSEKQVGVEQANNLAMEQPEKSEPSEKAEMSDYSDNSEMLIEDSHTENPQEFKEDVDLVRHHSNVDFPYFFGWLGGLIGPKAETGIGWIKKGWSTGKKIWQGFKSMIWDDLIWKETLGLGKKKELSKEEKETQAKQAANKRMFFETLRAGLGLVLSSQRRQAMKARLEKLNRSLKRSNLSYEGDLDQNGQIRESVLLAEELANSKMNEQQLLAEKQKKMMMAKPMAKKGPGITMSADKSHNFNNAAKLAG